MKRANAKICRSSEDAAEKGACLLPARLRGSGRTSAAVGEDIKFILVHPSINMSESVRMDIRQEKRFGGGGDTSGDDVGMVI